MVCIYCGSLSKTTVVNSRTSAKTSTTWRRRNCSACGSIFTTREYLDYTGALGVQKNDTLKPFQRDYLFVSVYNSLSHRKTALSDATELTDTIIKSLLKLQTNGVLSNRHITETTADTLQRFDLVAATYYQARH